GQKNREDAPQGRPRQLQLRCWLSPQMPGKPRRAAALPHSKFGALARLEPRSRHQRAMRKPRAPQTTLSEIDYTSISPPHDDSGKSCRGRAYPNRPPDRYLHRYPWSSLHAYDITSLNRPAATSLGRPQQTDSRTTNCVRSPTSWRAFATHLT